MPDIIYTSIMFVQKTSITQVIKEPEFNSEYHIWLSL